MQLSMMENRNFINEFAERTAKTANLREVEILYRMLNFLTDVTEKSRNNIHLTETERHCLFRSLLETKQAIIKELSKKPDMFRIFLTKRHLPS